MVFSPAVEAASRRSATCLCQAVVFEQNYSAARRSNLTKTINYSAARTGDRQKLWKASHFGSVHLAGEATTQHHHSQITPPKALLKIGRMAWAITIAMMVACANPIFQYTGRGVN